MPPKKVKAYKILKDKHGTRFVTIENKRIKIPGTITDVAFIKWLIQYLGPRARRSSRYPRMSRDRRPKGKPAIQRAVEPDLTNPNVMAYTNNERQREGLKLLKSGDKPGEIGFEEIPAAVPVFPDEEAVPATPERPKGARKLHPKTEMKALDLYDKATRTEVAEGEAKRAHEAKAHAEVEAKGAHDEKQRAQDTLAKRAVELTMKFFEGKAAGSYTKAHLIMLAAKVDTDMKHAGTRPEWTKKALIDYLLEHEEPTFMKQWKPKLKSYMAEERALGSPGMAGRGDDAPGPRDGMTTDQIDATLAALKPHYLGTISRNGWDQLTPAAHAGKSAWIMNTDKTGKPGTHWVAFLIDLDDKTAEYYDSFAGDLDVDVDRALVEFIKKNAIREQYLKLKINGVIDQDANSDNCGWFCVRFVLDRFRGKKWREVTKFDDSVKGEAEIAAFKKKYPYDRYI